MGGKRKADVGPEPPKRPQSGYGQFLAEKRAEIGAALLKEGVEQKKIMTATAKRAGELWKALGETKQKPYNEKSAKLSAAHQKEMEAFKTANPDFKKVKKGKNKDKPPSRPGGAYAIWQSDNRSVLTEKVMKEHKVDKSKAFFMLYKEGKTVYDALSAAEKKKYEEKAEAAKVKFQVEMKEWKETKGSTGGDKGPKRPIGAYPQWIQDNRPMLVEKVMKVHGVDRSKAFLMLYKEGKPVYDALPAKEKKACEEKAEAAKVKFKAEQTEWKENNKGAKAANGADEDAEGEEDDEDDEEEEEEEDDEN